MLSQLYNGLSSFLKVYSNYLKHDTRILILGLDAEVLTGSFRFEDKTEFYTYSYGAPSHHFKTSNNYAYAKTSGVCEQYVYVLIESIDQVTTIKKIDYPLSSDFTVGITKVISNLNNLNKTIIIEALVQFTAGVSDFSISATNDDGIEEIGVPINFNCIVSPSTIPITYFNYVYRNPYKSEYMIVGKLNGIVKNMYSNYPVNIEITYPPTSNTIIVLSNPMEYKYNPNFRIQLSHETTNADFMFLPKLLGGSIQAPGTASAPNKIITFGTELLALALSPDISIQDYNCGEMRYRQCIIMSRITTLSTDYFIAAFDSTTGYTGNNILTFPVYGKPSNFTQMTLSNLENGVTSGGVKLSSFEKTKFDDMSVLSHKATLLNYDSVKPLNYDFTPSTTQTTVTAIGCLNVYGITLDKPFQDSQQTYNQIPFPFGYKSVNSTNYYIDLTTPVSKFQLAKYFKYSFSYSNWVQTFGKSISDSISITDTIAPIVSNLEYLNSVPNIKTCTIRITVSDNLSGVKSVTYTAMDSTQEKVIYIYNGYYSNIIQGLGVMKCIFDLPIPKQYLVYNFKIKVSDYADNYNEYSINSPLVDLKRVEFPPLKKLELSDITLFKFDKNDIDISNGPYTNKLSIKLNPTTVPNHKEFVFEFNPIYNINFLNKLNDGADDIENGNHSPPSFTSVWDEDTSSHIIDFEIPARLFTGVIPYYIHPLHLDSSSLVSLFGESYELRVTCEDADVLPPLISYISVQSTSLLIPKVGEPSIKVYFVFTFVEKLNGLVEANFTIISDVNPKGIPFNFKYVSPWGPFGTIYCDIHITSLDVPQNYSIGYISLKDGSGHISKYPDINYINSLYSEMNQPYGYWFKTEYQVGAEITLDTTPPVLKTLQTVSTINEAIKQVQFTFSVQDLQSGILVNKTSYFPIVYLTDSNSMVLTGVTLLVGSNSTDANFLATINIPYGFGVGEGLLISIYGIYNNHMVMNGYSAHGLAELGLNSHIVLYYSGDPVIESIESTTSNKMWIKGYRFGIAPVIQFTNTVNQNDVYKIDKFTTIDNLIVAGYNIYEIDLNVIPKLVTKSIDAVYYVKVIDSFGGPSNNNLKITIYGIATPIPTISPLPTNKPQECIGKPECSGNGICSSTGCICTSPWIGNDCSSKVIIVPQPNINITNPSTEIPIIDNGNGNGNETSNYLFKSLISIVSLRELDHNQVEIKSFTFDKWIHTTIDENTSNYNTSIIVKPIDGSIDTPTTTNITVKLQWYKNETIVNFANEQITMKPSSMKYTIEISSYKFESNLNQLQLLMLASLESSKTDNVCSSSEFGETSTGDNSNYIKIQIDNKSLYGRFIKRAIVDGFVLTIDNIPLDKSFNPIKEALTLQSYIGITIPNFKKSIIVDPDFSVLVNSNSVSFNDENSICTNSNNGLTKPQLAGIIVGSIVIGCAIIGAVVFTIVKKSTRLRVFVKQIKMKNFK